MLNDGRLNYWIKDNKLQSLQLKEDCISRIRIEKKDLKDTSMLDWN